MKKILTAFIACAFILSISAQTTITVNTTDKKQNIRGMGAQWNESMKDDLINDIGVAVIRLWFGAGTGYWDETTNDNNDTTVLDLTKFSTISPSNVAALQEAQKRGSIFFITVGSPPIWMKDTTSSYMFWKVLQAKGEPATYYMIYRTAYDAGGELKTSMMSEFGEFVLGATKKFYEQLGFYPYAVSTQNEPEFPEPYFSCVYSGTTMRDATKAIGRFLAKDAAIPTKVMMAELTAQNTSGAVLSWPALINNDAQGKNIVSIFGLHAYSDDPMGGGMGSPSVWAKLYAESQRVAPVKEMWQTEGGPGYSDTKSILEIAMGGASEFYKAMKFGNCNVFCVYGFGRNESTRYSSIKNMIRYIRPGSYRVTANTNASDSTYILPLVFKDDTKGYTTIYIANTASVNKTVKMTGLTGNFDAFQTTSSKNCEWIGSLNVANDIVYPANSITTLINCTKNKLPNINPVDTIVILKNGSTKIVNLSGITDGGDGGQKIILSARAQDDGPAIFNSVSTTYTSPNTTGTLNISPKSDQTGNSVIYLSVKDNSTAMDSMFNEKVLGIPIYIIPFVNRAPSFDDIADVTYQKNQINVMQILMLTSVVDGNDGSQTLTLSATSSNAAVATVVAAGKSQLKITPKAEGTVTITVTLTDNGVNVGGGKGSVTKTFKVIVGNGIYLETVKTDNTIFPNPAHDKVTIMNEGLVYQAYSVFDMNGRIVLQGILPDEQNVVNTADLVSGVYIVKLINGSNALSAKLIIE